MLAGYHNSTPERRGSLPAVLNNVGGTSQRYSANITEEILKYIPGHDNRTIYSGLESANGIHQGSLKHAKNNFESARSVALGLQAPGTAGSSTQYNIRDTTSSPEGVVSIKKLLLKRTIRAAQDSSNPSGFETPYDEEFLPIIRDADAKSELAHQVKRAINMNKVNNSSDKLASCAIIYLEDCFEALNVLDEIFQLKKSNLGEDNDHQFMRWASGGSKRITKSNDIHHDPLHIWSRYYDRLGIPPREHDEMSSHPVKQIPLSFTWEPFRFKWRTLSNDSHDVRRLMFTFEFLVPYPCAHGGCDGKQRIKLLQSQYNRSIHFHAFTQRRSVLIQTSNIKPTNDSKASSDGKENTNWAPNKDQLCIISDLPLTTSSTRDIPLPYEGWDKEDHLRLLFYASLGPAKYRFRPSFHLNEKSEEWYIPALMQFILKDILVSWEPLMQACMEHVQCREILVTMNFTNNSELKSHIQDLWQDRQNWIYLRTTLEAHLANISRLQPYVAETFTGDHSVVKEMFDELASGFEEIGKKIEMQLQARTSNLVDLLYARINYEEAHISAKTGGSMKRLSWITFIFLPLSFLAGFFGMNVVDLENSKYLTIKWYFVISIAMLIIIIMFVCLLKKIRWEMISSMNKKIGNSWRRHTPCGSRRLTDLEANPGVFLLHDLQLERTETNSDRPPPQPLAPILRANLKDEPATMADFKLDMKTNTIKERTQEVIMETNETGGYSDRSVLVENGSTSGNEASNSAAGVSRKGL